MRKLVYYIGVSIDGYIAGPNGEGDFYPQGDETAAAAYMSWVNERYPETVPTHFRPLAGLEDAPNLRFDTVVMGTSTYRTVLDHSITSPYAHLRQYVVTRSIDGVADDAVELVPGDDALALVRRLKQEDGMDVWLCGGGKLAGSLLSEIDELIVKSYPVVAGDGAPVFGGAFSPTVFTPTDRRSFDNGATITWYSRRPAGR